MSNFQKLFFGLFLVVIVIGCGRVSTYTAYKYTPIYISLYELRSSVSSLKPQQIGTFGKIWLKNNYIFINDVGKGVHVIDNSNPSLPKNISFINIPGNYDLAVRGNILYADSYIDLLALDISDPTNVILKKRIEGILPNPLNNFGGSDPAKGVVKEWKIDTIQQEFDRGMGCASETVSFDVNSSPTTTGGENSVSKGGSMARFTLYDDYLYTVNATDLQVFTIKDPADPKVWSRINVGMDIETIYPFKDKLFIGSQTGMYIFNNSNPEFPTREGEFSHARACDPVVANDNYAYVTLRTGNRCNGVNNQLDVLDITDLQNPRRIRSYPMQSPYGLALGENNTLYVCDGEAGLKVFDVKNPKDIRSISHVDDLSTYDVIIHNELGIVVGKEGLIMYDCHDPKNIKLISKIIK